MYPHRIRLRGPWEYEPITQTVVDADGVRAEDGAGPPAGRLKIPTSWRDTPLEGFAGRVRFRRIFRSPRRLDPEEHVWLVFAGVDYFAEVSLNSKLLGRHAGYFERFEFEITSLLRSRNELVIHVDVPREADPNARRLFRGVGDGAGGGIWNDVVLEIRPGVRLCNVRVEIARGAGCGERSVEFPDRPPHSPHPTLHVSGQVVGEFSAPLTLDLSLNGRSLGDKPVDTSPAGKPFQFAAQVGHLVPWHTWNEGAPAVHELRLELHGAARTLDTETVAFGLRAIPAAQPTGAEPKIIRLEPPSGPWARQVAVWRAEGVTCLRVPGRVLPAGLYDELDLAGISIWQDFPAGRGQANDTPTTAEAIRQARALVRQLRHHPSIAAWCCGAPGRPGTTSLETAVRNAIQEEDPERPCC